MDKIFKIKNLILIGIILVAVFLRFYKLDQIPALNADEAAIGYNAFSLIATGKDEHGNPWPIHFQSFNDYKPGLYFYLVLPFVKLLGLNIWAVRIPGALLSTVCVFLIYLLVKELFKNERLAMISALFLAISPWHIHFSRGGWEVSTATTLMTAGIWLFIKSMNNKVRMKYLVYSIICLVASLYTYHAERVVVPLLGIILIFTYWKEIRGNFKKIFISGLVGIILVLPLVRDVTSGAVASRAAGVGLFADTGPLSRIEEQRGEQGNVNNVFGKVLHNKLTNYGLAFLSNWAVHYWGEFLFLSGDIIQRNRVPETGQLYLIDILFVSVGLIVVIKSFSREKAVVATWLIVAPVAAALTFQAPHALRSHNLVIPLIIIAAFGCNGILNFISKFKKAKNIGYDLVAILIIWGLARYEHMYWVHMTKEYPYSSQYGVKELVDYIETNQDKYKKILVTNRYDQPYILFLFYTKYDPIKFQNDHELTGKDQFGFSTVNHFDKYYFSTIKFQEAKTDNPNSLIVGTSDDIPKEANIVKDIYGSNGFLYFRIVAN